MPARIVAIGDLHGDVRALGAILVAAGLIDREAHWCGGATHLVLLGDLVGGHACSRLLLNAVLRLEVEASRAGGRVHALLGNHDVLPAAGRFGKMTRAERALYASPPVPGATDASLRAAFRGPSVYGRWLRRRNALLRIGPTLFVHAGVDRWALEVEGDAVNDAVRAWVRHVQGEGPLPPRNTRWAIHARRGQGPGPLWMRSFKENAPRKDGPPPKRVQRILRHLRVKRVVVGHAPTAAGRIVRDHPRYGASVVLADTRISNERRGRMSALVIEGARVAELYTDERVAGLALEAKERTALLQPLPLAVDGGLHRIWRWLRKWVVTTRVT